MQTEPLTSWTASIATLLFWGLLVPQAGHGQSNYAAFELRRDDNWGALDFVDLNGDGRKDIVVPSFDPTLGRELLIYDQLADGNFESNPRRIEIKTEIIAVDFADLRPEPGEELILFASDGVFSLSSQQAGYAGNLKLLTEWRFLAGIPDLDRVHFVNLATDVNADGLTDLLLPGDDRYGLFVGQPGERFAALGEFSTLNEGMTPIQRLSREADLDAELNINADEGLVLDLRVVAPTPFAGFVEQWENQSEATEALLDSEQWMPTPVLAELDGDGRPDIAYVNAGEGGLGQVNLHYQRTDGGFAARPDWQVSMDSRGDMRLVDLNNDGRDDILRLQGDGNDWTAYLTLNRAGRFSFQQPDQILRFSGYDVEVQVLQLEAGSAPVLSVSYYEIPVVEAIREASINRVQLLYAAAPEGSDLLFSNRPSSRLEEPFSAANVRGLAEQMSLRYDVDGDGHKDALYITDKGTLAARRIANDLQIETEPFWEYVSPRSVFEFEVLSLNGDNAPDLVLRHGTSTTVLVARP